jgi:hypothetical protein
MTTTERVLGYHARGFTPAEIWKLMEGEASAGTIRLIIEKHYGSQNMSKVGSTFDFHVTGIGLMLFSNAASARGMTATELASELLRTIALENLVAVVLDGADEGASNVESR